MEIPLKEVRLLQVNFALQKLLLFLTENNSQIIVSDISVINAEYLNMIAIFVS